MRVVFMGTPVLAASVLRSLSEAHLVVGVYTRPDAVRGRGSKLVASPVKQVAQELGVPVFTPATLRDADVQAQLAALAPDVACVAAYGAILPREVLDIPRLGCLNVHTSLLPRWRGAAPMQRAILARDETTGVCIMRMEEGLDTGPYCRRVEVPLGESYLADVESALAKAGSEALLDALDALERGCVEWTGQDDAAATYAAKIGKGEFDLDPEDNAAQLCAKVRASDAAHPAHARVAGRDVTVERASVARGDVAELARGLAPGQAVFRSKRFLMGTADGAVELLAVKPQGKKSMDARSFAAGIQGIRNATLTWERA